jgi:hypothetical protein
VPAIDDGRIKLLVGFQFFDERTGGFSPGYPFSFFIGVAIATRKLSASATA